MDAHDRLPRGGAVGSRMRLETKWLRFQLQPQPPQRKTSRWTVYAVEGDVALGRIEWYGAWRQYVFYPESDCLFNRTCLRDLAQFLDDAMAQRAVRPETMGTHEGFKGSD